MYNESSQKVTVDHLQRDAWLYVRQSTLRQVFENTESTQRQYALRQRAVALGWQPKQIHVIDTDQGRSGADCDREGFQKLVSEVSLGKAGIVMGLEVSRLARNSTDWHRLLEICALTNTLILDEDGIYDPGNFNDRILLGLKGTMSEAELHVLKARLHGGLLNAARRGELKMRLPIGLVYDDEDKVALDPDLQIRGALKLLFETFEQIGSARGTVKNFRSQEVKFPSRPHTGPNKGQLLWGELRHSQVLNILHNPRYAGAFVYGRSRTCKNINQEQQQLLLPRDQWQIVLHDAHVGYINWNTFDANQRRLRDNAQARGKERRSGPPREGVALLQGIVICGRCGGRMTIRYGSYEGRSVPHYLCQHEGIEGGKPICQHIPGAGVDKSIGHLLVELVTPMNLDVALAVEQELQTRLSDADNLRAQDVERANHEAQLAQRRYQRVDPDNRLVADVLEATWNEKLRALQKAQENYEHKCQTDRQQISDEQKESIRAIAKNFPRIWNDSATAQKERKRLVRLLIEDVTLLKAETLQVQIRFRGGKNRILTLPLPQRSWELRQTNKQVLIKIDQLLDHYTDRGIAEQLNEAKLHSGWGREFTANIVYRLRREHGLKSRYDRLREAGMVSREEIMEQMGVCRSTVQVWREKGFIKGYAYTDGGSYLYEPLDENNLPKKFQRKPKVQIGQKV